MRAKLVKGIKSIIFSVIYMFLSTILFAYAYTYLDYLFDYLGFNGFWIFNRTDLQAAIAASAILLQGYKLEKLSYKKNKSS